MCDEIFYFYCLILLAIIIIVGIVFCVFYCKKKRKKNVKNLNRQLKEGISCEDEWNFKLPEPEIILMTESVRRMEEERFMERETVL